MMEADDPPELTVSMPPSLARSSHSHKDIVLGGVTLSVQRNLDSVLDSALSLDAWKSLPGDVRARLRDAMIQCPPPEILIPFYKLKLWHTSVPKYADQEVETSLSNLSLTVSNNSLLS